MYLTAQGRAELTESADAVRELVGVPARTG